MLRVKELYHDKDVDISKPVVAGDKHPLYIVTHNKEKLVFKFSDKESAFRNLNTSKVLRKHGIPVPNIQVYRLDGKYCELYDFIEGKTLFERNQEGISEDTILKIYNQLYDICQKMSKIPLSEMVHLEEKHEEPSFFDLFKHKKNIEQKKVVGHDNLNDKNILLDKDDNVCGILGLDAVSIKPLTEHFIRLFDIAKENGYNIEEIKEKHHNGLLQKIVAIIKPEKGL